MKKILLFMMVVVGFKSMGQTTKEILQAPRDLDGQIYIDTSLKVVIETSNTFISPKDDKLLDSVKSHRLAMNERII